MKISAITFCAALLVFTLASGAPAIGQSTPTPAAGASTGAASAAASPAVEGAASAVPSEGRHYLVRSALGAERGALLLARLEALFHLYTTAFRFNEDRLQGKLVVREFATKADFDAYLLSVSGETRGDFVYLHFPSPQRRELLLYPKAEAEFSASLSHQAFIQYLKAFVQDPPLWMRDGFAVFFENVRWERGSEGFSYLENLAWLETVKSLKGKGGLIKLDRLIAATAEEARSAIEVFYPEAWAFVSFLANDNTGAYSRLLWETIATLGADASLADNQAAFAKRLVDWYGMDATSRAFEAYLDSRKTFPELVALGTEDYGKKDFDKAVEAFAEAARIDPSSYIPPYYLGLIAYSKAQYPNADTLFREAIARGCDLATATYALGLNAVARGLIDEGAATLQKAALANPEKYKVRVEEILKRLGK